MMDWKKTFLAGGLAGLLLLSGCSLGGRVRLDPDNPVAISIWHYYNGTQKMAFDEMVDEFNEKVGPELGILVEFHNQGGVAQLEESVMAAVNKEPGSPEMPDVFASYSDMAYTLDQMGLLADLEPYFSKKEQEEYIASYIDEGRIGASEQLKIFPTAKSTELFMMNKTDWEVFAAATDSNLSQLETMEGLVQVAQKYYNWTDAQTPDIPDDGRAFFGRDAWANLFLSGAEQLDARIFEVQEGTASVNLDPALLRRIWDNFYLPHIRGYFAAYGRFRSDDAKVGEILSLVGSTSSASYFPTEVIYNEQSHPIEPLTLPLPVFEGGKKVAVQQGAGMVVTKGDPKKEYAAVVFLKWFTEKERNIRFAASSGYMPVRKDANDFALLTQQLDAGGDALNETMRLSLQTAFETANTYTLYCNKPFKNGSAARKVLENHLADKLAVDLEAVKAAMEAGATRAQAVAPFEDEANFEAWCRSFQKALEDAVNGNGEG